MGGIGQDTTENDLIAYFSAFGKIINATLLNDPQTGRHRGFAFVAFEDESTAEVVCAKRYHQIGGKTAEAKRAQQQAQSRGGIQLTYDNFKHVCGKHMEMLAKAFK